MLFKDNQKLTLVFISSMLATTVKREIITTRQVDGRQAYKARGKRKEYYLKLDNEMLVFDGWQLPYKLDTDTNQFAGNSCYNFIAQNWGYLKTFIRDKNLNESFDQWMNIDFQYEGLRGDTYIDLFNEEELLQLQNHI